MACCLKAAHIQTDLGENDQHGQRPEARNFAKQLGGAAKGFDVAIYLLVDVRNGRIDGVELGGV